MLEFFAEFSFTDWLLVLGPLLILSILIHGYWRMHVNRSSLRMALDKSFVSDIKDSNHESDEFSMLRAELPNGGARVLGPTEQTSLNLEDDVPVLMNTVSDEDVQEVSEPAADAKEGGSSEGQAAPATPVDLPEKYVVINVMSSGEPFQGQQLLECLLELGMSLGEMDIFHRYDGKQSLFSLMNAVEPGSFDIATMNEIETPAISLFMRVHEMKDPVMVFDQMLSVASGIANELGGEVRDETRSVMTTQTMDHCRQELEHYVFKYHA